MIRKLLNDTKKKKRKTLSDLWAMAEKDGVLCTCKDKNGTVFVVVRISGDKAFGYDASTKDCGAKPANSRIWEKNW